MPSYLHLPYPFTFLTLPSPYATNNFNNLNNLPLHTSPPFHYQRRGSGRQSAPHQHRKHSPVCVCSCTCFPFSSSSNNTLNQSYYNNNNSNNNNNDNTAPEPVTVRLNRLHGANLSCGPSLSPHASIQFHKSAIAYRTALLDHLTFSMQILDHRQPRSSPNRHMLYRFNTRRRLRRRLSLARTSTTSSLTTSASASASSEQDSSQQPQQQQQQPQQQHTFTTTTTTSTTTGTGRGHERRHTHTIKHSSSSASYLHTKQRRQQQSSSSNMLKRPMSLTASDELVALRQALRAMDTHPNPKPNDKRILSSSSEAHLSSRKTENNESVKDETTTVNYSNNNNNNVSKQQQQRPSRAATTLLSSTSFDMMMVPIQHNVRPDRTRTLNTHRPNRDPRTLSLRDNVREAQMKSYDGDYYYFDEQQEEEEEFDDALDKSYASDTMTLRNHSNRRSIRRMLRNDHHYHRQAAEIDVDVKMMDLEEAILEVDEEQFGIEHDYEDRLKLEGVHGDDVGGGSSESIGNTINVGKPRRWAASLFRGRHVSDHV